jgi:hypothetical protein
VNPAVPLVLLPPQPLQVNPAAAAAAAAAAAVAVAAAAAAAALNPLQPLRPLQVTPQRAVGVEVWARERLHVYPPLKPIYT